MFVENRPWVEKYRPKSIKEMALPMGYLNLFLTFSLLTHMYSENRQIFDKRADI